MSSKRIFNQAGFLVFFIAGLLTLGASLTRAQEGPQSNDNEDYNADPSQDPPSRVARMSDIEGTVSFQPGGQGDWGAAVRNRPVTVGDKIWSDANSRAELQAGQASIRLSSMTALSFLNLDEQTTQMRLAEGSVNFRVRELREGDVYEVDAPNVAFNVTQAGAFRVDVNENGDGTRITAIRGEGQVTANGQTYTIHAGERGEFNGSDNVTYFVAAAPAPDGFDRWSDERDRREDNSISARYVSREIPGYDDLDENGTWDEVPEYGHVWYPTVVDVGWSPYSYGYWNYVGPWGWTWVGAEPWGFAPYHYGRWNYIGNRWGWCPGPYYARPVYGPAFVGFVGGSHWGVGFGIGGGVGWFPLGWGEPYRPWYRASNRYYRNVNINNTYIRNTTIINNRTNNFNYAYAHNAHAVTVASRNNFANGQAIRPGSHRMNSSELRGAQVSNRADISPNRQSYFGAAGARSHIARPSASVQDRPVMARTTPAAAAAHMPVRTFNNGNNQSGRGGFNSGNGQGSRSPVIGRTAQTGAAANANRPAFTQSGPLNGQRGGFPQGSNGQNNPGVSSRQRELSLDKPQSHMRNAPSDPGGFNGRRGQANSNVSGNERNAGGNRNWSAQGTTTDRGRGPSGFGANSSRADSSRGEVARNTANRSDRPPSAYNPGNGNSGYSVSPRSSSPGNRPDYSNSNRGNSRSYEPPQRNSGYPGGRPSNNSNPNRGYSQRPTYESQPNRGNSQRPAFNQDRGGSQPRSYSPPQRGYSQPSYSQPRGNSSPRGYSAPSAPSRSSSPGGGGSAPSRNSGGGGGGNHGGGGGNNGGNRGGGSPHGRP